MKLWKRRFSYVLYFLKNTPKVLGYRLFHIKPSTKRFRGKALGLESTNQTLKDALDSSKPFSAIRFGAVELSCLNNHEKIELGWRKKYKESVRYSIKNNAGYFPTDEESLKRYGDVLFPLLQEVDFLGISGLHMEDYFARYYCPKSFPILYEGMEPLHGDWTTHLKGKKVLVISPFKEDILSQYQKRQSLFPKGSDILPEMDLKVIEAPLTFADATPTSPSFFDELEKMESQMKETDFDVLLVGAGAYGSFLALYAKSLGKQGIQTGGATSTLFGIMGRRWENRRHVSQYVNENWIHPTKKVEGFKKVENGAYW